MAGRAHPEEPGCSHPDSICRKKLFERYDFCNSFITGKRVLDIPCGTGWGTSMLHGYHKVMGIDCAEEAIAYALTHFANPKLFFKVGDMANIPVSEDSVDVVLCLEGFEHVSKDVGEKFLHESSRVLVREGLMLMTCPVLDERGKITPNPFHIGEYPEEELIDMLNRLFRIHTLERIKGSEGPQYRVVLGNIKGERYC
jgi:ubiquinone/menaquinone biosynthesis C-methylase UbiE